MPGWNYSAFTPGPRPFLALPAALAFALPFAFDLGGPGGVDTVEGVLLTFMPLSKARWKEGMGET